MQVHACPKKTFKDEDDPRSIPFSSLFRPYLILISRFQYLSSPVYDTFQVVEYYQAPHFNANLAMKVLH